MTERYDALVIGAGHNGLTAALTLAASGRKVVIVERADSIGGLCAPYEFAPGYRVPGLVPDTSRFRPHLIERLGLHEHGLELREQEPAVFLPITAEGVLLHRDPGDARGGLSRLSDSTADAYAKWRGFLTRVSPFVRRILDAPPPPLVPEGMGDMMRAGATGLALRRLGKQTMTEVLRVLPMAAADWLGESFELEDLAAALAAPALIGSYHGPWAAGSAAALLFDECSAGRSIEGGATALAAALGSACAAAGVDIQCGAAVEKIVVDRGRATGVELAGGASMSAGLVLAACASSQAMLDLVGPRHLEAGIEHDLRRFRCRGTTAVLLLAVDGSVELAARPGEGIERLRLGATGMDDLERAYDAVKYGRWATAPYLEVWIPSLSQPDLAPAGGHVVAALVSSVPYELAEGWTSLARESLTQAVVHQLNEYIPGIRDRLTGGRLLAPPDLERTLGLPGGHLSHGEETLDQRLFLRPTLALSSYSTPIDGLFLGGSAQHPGGGITGMPGRLAAEAALAS